MSSAAYLCGKGIHENLVRECDPKDFELVHGRNDAVELVECRKDHTVGPCRQDVESNCAPCNQHCNVQECACHCRDEQESLYQNENRC